MDNCTRPVGSTITAGGGRCRRLRCRSLSRCCRVGVTGWDRPRPEGRAKEYDGGGGEDPAGDWRRAKRRRRDECWRDECWRDGDGFTNNNAGPPYDRFARLRPASALRRTRPRPRGGLSRSPVRDRPTRTSRRRATRAGTIDGRRRRPFTATLRPYAGNPRRQQVVLHTPDHPTPGPSDVTAE